MKGKLLLLGLGLLSTALLIALGLSWLRASTEGETLQGAPQGRLPEPFASLPSARQAYSTLEKWASSWATDASLVALSCTVQREAQQPANWSFQVYSPSRQQIANVLVEGQQVWVLRELSALYPQTPFPMALWTTDSTVILENWWTGRGQALWGNPQAQTLSLHLGLRPDGLLTWQVTLLSQEGQVIDFQAWRADTAAQLDTTAPGGEP
jgi:hypothetical protein